MTAQRPNAIVFQEYTTLTVTPDVPDLNVLIVGTAKQILDYLDDKTECYAAEYGTFQGNCPAAAPTAVVVSTPPEAEPGIVLDSSAVYMYFDEAQVIVVESPAPVGIQAGVYTLGDNLFEAHDTTGGAHFSNLYVIAGDTLIVENAGTADYIMTVKELCFTLHDYDNDLHFITGANPVQPGDIVTITNDTAATPRNGVYTVKRVVSDEALEVVSATWTGNAEALACTADIAITDAYGAARCSGAGVHTADYCNVRTTSDFISSAVGGDLRKWRVERLVNDIELDTTDFDVSGNSVTVHAAITVDITSLLTSKKVSYAKIYEQYTATRTDLQTLTTYSNYTEIETGLGKYDARNPLMVGATVAKANTTTPIKVYGVIADTLPEYLEFIDNISSERDVYAIVPLTYSTSIIASINAMCTNLADPNYALAHGIKQKFRVVIGALDLVTSKFLVNATGSCTTSVQAGTSPATTTKLTLTAAGGAPPDLFTCGILPGDIFEMTDVTPPGTTTSYTVVQVNDHTEFEVATTAASDTLNGAGDYYQFTRGGVLVAGTNVTVGGGVVSVTRTAAVTDDLYLNLDCPDADFLTSGCIPGDYIQMPTNPTVNTWTGTLREFEIDEVVSNQRVRIVNHGNNTATVENELPHGGRRTDGSEIVQGTLYCRVFREMDKTQQVAELVTTAQSFSSKRTLLCFPNEVIVTDLVDGSLVRSGTTPEAAGVQPGYYLSCAVGGQTAGNPSQQGFTNKGIAGISRIYNTTGYFAEEQITDLSNGGVYTFAQDTPNSLPYSIHELTTDVSALEFSEYMVVKNFDFIAWTFLDVILPFIGVWNVTEEAIEFIRQSLYTTGSNLKARKVAKIGPPLLGFQIDSVAQSTLSTDRIEAYMQVDLPMTLNTIGLHLVA